MPDLSGPEEVFKFSLHEYARLGLKVSERLERLKKDHALDIGPQELFQLNKKFGVTSLAQHARTTPGPGEPSEDEIWMLVQAKLDQEQAALAQEDNGTTRAPLSVAEVHKMLVLDGHTIPRETVRKIMKREKAPETLDAAIPDPSEVAPNRDPELSVPVATTACNAEPAGPNVSSTSIDTAVQPLATLLDLTGLETHPSLTARFDEIARSLILGHYLHLTSGQTSEEYSILEAEFYLLKPGSHEDPFTHGAVEQRKAGQWYFHRAPKFGGGVSTTSWRDGTRKGLDLTFGGPVETLISGATWSTPSDDASGETRGGILLRTLLRRSDSHVICGPSLLADEIISKSGAGSIGELVADLWGGDTSAFGSGPDPAGRRARLSVTKNIASPEPTNPNTPTLYNSPRIGLDLSNPTVTATMEHPRVLYISKPYRYFIKPALFADKGRAHSFVGVYSHLLASPCPIPGRDWDSTSLSTSIASILSIRPELASKYMGHFHANDKGDLKALKKYIGKAGKGASSSPGAFLGMMGLLVDGKRAEEGGRNMKQQTLSFGRRGR